MSSLVFSTSTSSSLSSVHAVVSSIASEDDVGKLIMQGLGGDESISSSAHVPTSSWANSSSTFSILSSGTTNLGSLIIDGFGGSITTTGNLSPSQSWPVSNSSTASTHPSSSQILPNGTTTASAGAGTGRPPFSGFFPSSNATITAFATSATVFNSTANGTRLASTGEGTDYAFACETEWSSYDNVWQSYYCTPLGTTYTSYLYYTTELYSAPVSTACGSVLYGEGPPVVTGTISTFLSYPVSCAYDYDQPQLPVPEPSCSPKPSDCLPVIQSWERDAQASAAIGSTKRGAHCRAYPQHCSKCTINGNNVQLIFFSVPSTASRDYCATAPGANAPIYNTPMYSGDIVPSVVLDGQTFYANKAYISYDVMFASTVPCVPRAYYTQVGGIYSNGIVTLESSEVSSVRYPNYGQPHPVNFADFNSPVPWSAFYGMHQGFYGIFQTLHPADYKPILAVPHQIRALDPAWADCDLNLEGIYDPPHALQTADALTTPSDPPAPGGSPPKVPPPTETPQPRPNQAHAPDPLATPGLPAIAASQQLPAQPPVPDSPTPPLPPPPSPAGTVAGNTQPADNGALIASLVAAAAASAAANSAAGGPLATNSPLAMPTNNLFDSPPVVNVPPTDPTVASPPPLNSPAQNPPAGELPTGGGPPNRPSLAPAVTNAAEDSPPAPGGPPSNAPAANSLVAGIPPSNIPANTPQPGPVPAPVPIGSVGAIPIYQDPSLPGGVVVGGTAIAPGSTATIDGTPVSVNTAGSVVVGSNNESGAAATIAIPLLAPAPAAPAAQPLGTVGSDQIFAAPGLVPGAILIGGATLSPGQSATIDGSVVSVGPSGSFVVSANGAVATTIAIPGPSPASPFAPLGTVNSVPVFADPSSPGNVLINGVSYAPGTTANINGQSITITPGGVVAGSGPSASTIAVPASGSSVTAAPGVLASAVSAAATFGTAQTVAVGGVPVTVNPDGSLLVSGSTLSVGGSAVTVSGTVVSAASGGLVVSGAGGAMTMPLNMHGQGPQGEVQITLGGQLVTMSALAPGAVVVNGRTLSVSGQAVTVNGVVISLGPKGLIVGGSTTLSLPEQTTRSGGLTSSKTGDALTLKTGKSESGTVGSTSVVGRESGTSTHRSTTAAGTGAASASPSPGLAVPVARLEITTLWAVGISIIAALQMA